MFKAIFLFEVVRAPPGFHPRAQASTSGRASPQPRMDARLRVDRSPGPSPGGGQPSSQSPCCRGSTGLVRSTASGRPVDRFGAGFYVREDQFPITIQGPNDSRPSWRPTCRSSTFVAGRVPRNEKAPATWTVLELKSIPPSAFGRAGVVAWPTPLPPLPIFSAQAWPHGALRVASGSLRQSQAVSGSLRQSQAVSGSLRQSQAVSGSLCRLTDRCQPVSFRHVRT
jgi:hypothetical protein